MSEEGRSDVRPQSPEPPRPSARRWSFVCPGGGLLVLGRRRSGTAVAACTLLALASLCVFFFSPSAVTFWVFAVLFVAALAAWVVETVAVRRLGGGPVRRPAPRGLLIGLSVGVWALAAGSLAMLVTLNGVVRIASGGMAPTLLAGERALYSRRVCHEALARGTLILFKAPQDTGVGRPGAKFVARIAAVPGDKLSVQGDRYVVNGRPGRRVGESGDREPVLRVPRPPGSLTVPEGRYFVVQDSPVGYDSRVLSWARREDIVSTRLLLFSRRGIARRIE